MRSAARASLVAAALAGTQQAQEPDALAFEAPRPIAVGAPYRPAAYAVETRDGVYEVWATSETPPYTLRVLADARFLPLRLVGYPLKDRLRLDRPASAGESTPAPYVRLPGGGALYRIGMEGGSSILFVDDDASVRLLLTLPDGPSGPALSGAVHVSPASDRIVLATTEEAGGEVYVIDLAGSEAPRCVTAELATLAIAPESVRVTSTAVWFVAEDVLYRDDLADAAPPEAVPLGQEAALPELALARSTDAVVVLLEKDDGKRKLFLVPASGSWSEVTTDFKQYDSPNYDHPLGPWLEVSSDAAVVGVREDKGSGHELHVQRVSSGQKIRRITEGPDFPGYVDNIGVLAFADLETLCFFGGDTKHSSSALNQEIGAADMYAADVSDTAEVGFFNVTRTNGQAMPPFTNIGSLTFKSALVDPLGERILLTGETADGYHFVSRFEVDGASGSGLNLEELFSDLHEEPLFAASPSGLVLLATKREVLPTSLLSCSEELTGMPLVRIRASNKSDAEDDGAKVWFDGTVALGEAYTIDAASAGKDKLENKTYIHVLDLEGNELQRVEIDTSCKKPLVLGARFGSSELLDYVGEYEAADGSYDYCGTGSKPAMLQVAYTGKGCGATASSQGDDEVTCAGDPLQAPLVNVLATNKEDPEDSKAKVWFAGQVALNEVFPIDASLEGKERLEDETYVHVFDLQDQLLQSVRFQTSCKEPLYASDRFGCLEITGCILEDEPLAGDDCATGGPSSLRLVYSGEGCAPRVFGPRPYLLDPDFQSPSTFPAQDLDTLFPPGTLLDRLVADQAGAFAAFVATTPDGVERSYRIDIDALQLEEMYAGWSVSHSAVFTEGGRLLLGLTRGGSAEIIQLSAPYRGPRIPLAGPGFPLGH